MKRTYIIAEAGVNHNGSVEMAKQLIDCAAEAGADAVKFQTFKAENSISQHAPKADYQLLTTGCNESQLEMVKRLELNEEAHHLLFEHCRMRNIQFLSTPFDLYSVNLLNNFMIPRFKLPSGEITNAPLLLAVAHTGKPVFLSTGMCSLGEVEVALGILAFGYLYPHNKPTIKEFANAFASSQGQAILRDKVVLLHCTTEYPAPFIDVNLRNIDTLFQAFGLPVGYSDHTTGIAIPIAAVARGATVIEKHFTLDRNLVGPDHKASIEPRELKLMVDSLRQVEAALGSSIKVPTVSDLKNREIARKSLVANCDISKGEEFSECNLTAKRPAKGISPIHYWEYLGCSAKKNYKKDEVI